MFGRLSKQLDVDIIMLTFTQAEHDLLAQATAVRETEVVSLQQALGRVLAEPCFSSLSVPPADNSAMDGYVLRCQDWQASDCVLPISQRIPAGESPQALSPGTVARIFTGAMIPEGADAVIMQEKAQLEGDGVCFSEAPKMGENIRRVGEDIASGDEILSVGQRLRPQDIGLAASVGLSELTVYRPLKVAIFSTGDELTEPGEPLLTGHIYNSNRYVLISLLQSMGCTVVDLGRVEDSLEATMKTLEAASQDTDVVITTGGVSVGEEDYVKEAVESLGQLNLWRVAIKPGKPLAFGRIGDALFLGLPGNPVSAFVTFCVLGRSLLLKMQGVRDTGLPLMSAVAGFDWLRPGKRQEYVRVRMQTDNQGAQQLQIFPHQGSGVLTSTVWAEGLAVIPIDRVIRVGDNIDWLPFSGLLA